MAISKKMKRERSVRLRHRDEFFSITRCLFSVKLNAYSEYATSTWPLCYATLHLPIRGCTCLYCFNDSKNASSSSLATLLLGAFEPPPTSSISLNSSSPSMINNSLMLEEILGSQKEFVCKDQPYMDFDSSGVKSPNPTTVGLLLL